MDLLRFQEEASAQIAQRLGDYLVDPLMVDRTRPVPFFQTLVSITGSGKTLMLADAINQIRSRLPREPVVLWLSKGRVVVWQTYANLAHGKYAANIPGYTVKPLLELVPADIEDSATPLLLMATAAKFARQDETDDRRVFQVQFDLATESLWNLLKRRRTTNGERRPLVVIYDEGQNLSDLQAERLLELVPDAIISASATPSVPAELERVISRLRTDRNWTDADFRTGVLSSAVVEAGLVKRRISLGGYVTPMETAIDAMLQDMRDAEEAAAKIDEPFRPKAIYVSSTNAVDGVPISEDVRRPFEERQARPIVIWRHLVASGIDPSKIAVYAQLQFGKYTPPRHDFNLFGGGDRDYDRFIQGDFEHIIFNLSLQEGWDDPMCGFAYIDKEMASATQITQVIGRVLRQPNARHYADPILNTAHFYIRSDEKGVFENILDDIRAQITDEHPSIELAVRTNNRRAGAFRAAPSKSRVVPTASIYSGLAKGPVDETVRRMLDFSSGGPNIVGQGARMQVLQEIGVRGATQYEWIAVEHSNLISARTIFRRELQRLFPGGLRRAGGPVNLVDIEEPKFDAMVEITSPAADHIRSIAAEVVDAYVNHSQILLNEDDPPYAVGPVALDPDNAVSFTNALHGRYSGLNPSLELPIARALDRTQRVWARNPEGSGYFIPLLDRGSTGTFWPDFLVWVDSKVVALETKGRHLLPEEARRKVLDIRSTGDCPRLVLRMISEGRWSVAPSGQTAQHGKDGFTVWKWTGSLNQVHYPDAATTVAAALQIDP
ncbi:DEAD/DEAH box helicase family protein [Salinarimonas ramus]|uniref:Type III restriction enzyme n=1 Tax=Salinarimonas ramus TaxID=690164 RepID=A0A917QFL3_9HYPH|nr:DEAD/DEAH box helicase family protein [Salinarimonas ramus]GGK49007.1 hypothetical protein GCM10011322_40030 [Salinarimonas ramus]